MTKHRVKHASFTLERHYDATPARVFAAWSDPESKRRWYFCDDRWVLTEHLFQFEVGGRERMKVRPPDGVIHEFDGVYRDIVPDQRIIYSYDMHVGRDRISVSLATVELAAEGDGTRLAFTEQGAFLDGLASPEEREEGTAVGLDHLGAWLRGELLRGELLRR
ncbi:MAG TPA: SRPBCC family protein [Polyangiaceae bacterium]|nr:SRPBCC family protein [Polyangiaceae bacterium]